MNQLSWLLYIGSITGNLGPVFAIVGTICVIICCISVCVGLFWSQTSDYGRYNATEMRDKTDYVRKHARKFWKVTLFLWLFCWLLAALCPSADTVYAIAASEMGGKVLNSQTGSLAEQALNAWLKRQINPPAVPDNK